MICKLYFNKAIYKAMYVYICVQADIKSPGRQDILVKRGIKVLAGESNSC